LTAQLLVQTGWRRQGSGDGGRSRQLAALEAEYRAHREKSRELRRADILQASRTEPGARPPPRANKPSRDAEGNPTTEPGPSAAQGLFSLDSSEVQDSPSAHSTGLMVRDCARGDDAARLLERTVFRHSSPPTESAWGFVINPPGTPQQPNDLDCGVHACLCTRLLAGTLPHRGPQWWYSGRDCVSAARYLIATEVILCRLLDEQGFAEGSALPVHPEPQIRTLTADDIEEWKRLRAQRVERVGGSYDLVSP
jgi:hypothetical protein